MTAKSGDGGARLRLGPGPRQSELEAVLEALGGRVDALRDLSDLLSVAEGQGRVLLDGEELPEEDVGILRRFVDRAGEWHVTVLGGDPRSRALSRVLELARTRFLAWPPDLDQLRALASGEADPYAVAVPPPKSAAPAPSGAAPRDGASAPARDADDDSHAAGADDAGVVIPAAPGAPPMGPVLSRLEGALDRLRSMLGDRQDAAGTLAAATHGVQELRAWTRRPEHPGGSRGPARADDDDGFDLGEVVEEVLAGVAVGGGDAPRFLYRSSGNLHMSGPRERLSSGLEALFRTARACAEAGTVVQVHAEAEPRGGALRLSVNFPSGGLEVPRVREVLEGERDELEELEGHLVGLAEAAEHLLAFDASLAVQSDTFHRLIVRAVLPRGRVLPRAAAAAGERGPKSASPELDPFA